MILLTSGKYCFESFSDLLGSPFLSAVVTFEYVSDFSFVEQTFTILDFKSSNPDCKIDICFCNELIKSSLPSFTPPSFSSDVRDLISICLISFLLSEFNCKIFPSVSFNEHS